MGRYLKHRHSRNIARQLISAIPRREEIMELTQQAQVPCAPALDFKANDQSPHVLDVEKSEGRFANNYFDGIAVRGIHALLFFIIMAAYFFEQFDNWNFGFIAPALSQSWGLKPTDIATILFWYFIGMTSGGFVGGVVSDLIGRRKTFLISIVIFSVSSIITGFTDNFVVFTIFRALTGFGVFLAEGLRGLLEPDYQLVGIVEDGRALLEAADRLMPDVVVADVSMPLLNGIEAVRQLKKNNKGVVVVFLTMHLDVAYAASAFEEQVHPAMCSSIRPRRNC